MRLRLSIPLVAGLLVLGMAACSSGGSDGGASASSAATPASSATTGAATATSRVAKRPPTDPLCVTAKKIFELDQQYSASFAAAVQKVTASTDPASFQAAMQELKSEGEFDSLLSAYDQLAEVVPEANRIQVATLRDYTSRLFDQVIGMPTVAELNDYIQNLQTSDDTITAGKAALALDNLTFSECGQHMSSG